MEKKPNRTVPPPYSLPIILLSSSSLNMTIINLILFLCFPILLISVSAQPDIAPARSFPAFTPSDNYLINCGATNPVTLPGNRTFQPDQTTDKFLQYTGRNIQVSLPNSDNSSNSNVSLSPIYLSARIFVSEATYTFHASNPGLHWIRLHFLSMNINEFNIQTSKFSVSTDALVLLRDFRMENNNTVAIVKEFLVNVTTERYAIKFEPAKGSFAFVNAIEFVTAPPILIDDSVALLFPVSQQFDMSNSNFLTMYRLNVGGPGLEATNDTLGRKWMPDTSFRDNVTGQVVSTQPSVINYPTSGGSPLIAPPIVYSSAVKMADSETVISNFNITWTMDIDTSYSYLVRLHFCDIISKTLNELYFNVYINDKMAISGLDLSTLTKHLSTAFYKDFVVNSSMISTPLMVRVSPVNDVQGFRNAILNGLEVFRINNTLGSLDGEYGAGKNGGPSKTVAYVGFAMMFGAFVGLGAIVFKWQKRPQDWQKRNSFSSWLLPLHAGDTSFMTSKTSMGSRKSQFYSSTMGLGRYFSFAELSDATKNWDPAAIIGVGGFGNVYLGEIDDGTVVAVKRGNPQSEQGINEFQTEIQMLSKLRHRHLVSLIGYCDENAEMILVYEFMKNGPFRDHLYGKNLPALSWKQRLEICIGSARGLHYLHTGAATGIIHRDVKTTNILLDENFIAKMADFGLSKDCVASETHVSTAVKGSFGYLDPEYFRKQQLTDKSDVYSFGVVLFEALCARPAINPALPREQVNLAEWAMQWKKKGLLDKIIDPTLVGHINPESMKKFAEAAEKCLAEYGVDRPTMGDVLWNLEYALQLQEASLQGKDEEENKAFAAPTSPATVTPAPVAFTATDNRPISSPEQGRNPAELQVIDEHSGTAMFAQFAELNGR